jgi:hypothetical protein
MNKRVSLPLWLPVVALTILALALGSVGTAAAGGLTKHAVKKIATKVVKKKASGLSVAQAATATNASDANALAGLPPAAYQNNVAVFTTSLATPVTSFADLVPLAPGNYVVTYSADLGGPLRADCYFRHVRGADSSFFGEVSTAATPYTPGLSGTGFVDIVAGDVLSLRCTANQAFTSLADEPIQITALKVDNVTSATITATRPGGSRPGSAQQH